MRSRSECWERFAAAVREAHEGRGNKAWDLVESVRKKFGDRAAERQERELRNYVDSNKPA
ncbi:hypothetical protein Bphy_1904 [Paraburkholderia phymatum STM815]|uniref:Uncharacterized protein n=1 Tax=Paraburkholderia phymatum (strain DSM 17167 / CIP 108236 / LMG 21445 / STM815) TaxID=391038 RepID=B2JD27_PARP8|nr:hypothetical protein Bphy_1904 [Paraburkholderia phymatum STM815]